MNQRPKSRLFVIALACVAVLLGTAVWRSTTSRHTTSSSKATARAASSAQSTADDLGRAEPEALAKPTDAGGNLATTLPAARSVAAAAPSSTRSANRQTSASYSTDLSDLPTSRAAPAYMSSDNFALVAGASDPALVAVAGTVRDYRRVLGENPVGDNAEITKALRGENARGTHFLDTSSATNNSGQLLDQWAHPYYFHQISASDMEVRSAGRDGVMWNGDDEVVR